MNKTKIDWCDYSWNPITGCRNGCFYCYARSIYKRFYGSFEPSFHPDRLEEPSRLKNPSRIFCGSVTDMWSKGVKEEWRQKVWDGMIRAPRHTFFVLTKQPDRIKNAIRVPGNCYLGVSVNHTDNWDRANRLRLYMGSTFVSVEPYMWGVPRRDDFCPDWVIIGAMTGLYAKNYEPSTRDLRGLVAWAQKRKRPVFMKNNLKPHWNGDLIQEFPMGLGAEERILLPPLSIDFEGV